MTEPREVRCCGAINCAYEDVRGALHRLELGSVLAPFRVHSIHDEQNTAGLPPVIRITLGCKDTDAGACPPVTSVEIHASALSSSRTRLELDGHCPPQNETAEAYVRTLLEDVIQSVRRECHLSIDEVAKPAV